MIFEKLTVNELHALAYEYYNETITQPGMKKVAVVEAVKKLYNSKPHRLDQVVLAEPAEAAPAENN